MLKIHKMKHITLFKKRNKVWLWLSRNTLNSADSEIVLGMEYIAIELFF